MTWKNLETLWDQYEQVFETNFKESGVKKVKKPDFINKKISQQTFALLFLMYNQERIISKKLLTDAYELISGKESNDFQAARHLGRMGYDISNKDSGINGYRLNSLSPRKIFFLNREGNEITEEVWEDKKKEYNFRCPCCGSLEGEMMLKPDANGITKLEKGHMDPRKPLTWDNCIPQCQYCNGISLDGKIFDKNGNVIEILS